ncbi:MAG TPA: hypothetical protein VEK73_01640 [Xanthobacteraceae bacterium]|nr:hypothetical protein [Xanthobacteraceae bacterium]
MDQNLKASLLASRRRLRDVLSAKFRDLPEWQAYCAIDNALEAVILDENQQAGRTAAHAAAAANGSGSQLSYVELGLQALGERGRPIPTPDMIEYIRVRRELPADLERAKINISSAFSHDERMQSVPWQGGRAWWYTGRAVPRE